MPLFLHNMQVSIFNLYIPSELYPYNPIAYLNLLFSVSKVLQLSISQTEPTTFLCTRHYSLPPFISKDGYSYYFLDISSVGLFYCCPTYIMLVLQSSFLTSTTKWLTCVHLDCVSFYFPYFSQSHFKVPISPCHPYQI